MDVLIKEFSEKGSKTVEKQLKDERPEGTWTFWDEKEKLMLIENYEKGKLEGVRTEFEKGKKIHEVTFVKGRKYGEAIDYLPNGKVEARKFYELDRLHGPFTKYYKNGQVEYEGKYIRNKRDGTWKYYDKKGKVTEEIRYKLGEQLPPADN